MEHKQYGQYHMLLKCAVIILLVFPELLTLNQAMLLSSVGEPMDILQLSRVSVVDTSM
jgi:hypothetical protein